MQHRRIRPSAALLLPAMFCAAALFSGCAGQEVAQGSTEWRLRMLEEKYLSYEEDRKARDGTVEERLRALEEKQAALSARMDGERASDGRGSDAPEAAPTDMQPDRAAAVPPTARVMQDATGAPLPGTAPAARPDGPGGASGPGSAGNGGRSVRPEPGRSAPPAKPVPPGKGKAARPFSDKAAYETALNLLQSGRVDEARVRFDGFLNDRPGSALTPNALYWKGEALYAQRRYADAIMAFKEVTARFPKHQKAADALLKIVLTYKQLGDDANMRFHLKALYADHPDTSAARLARQRFSGG